MARKSSVDRALRRDIRQLGSLLGEVLIAQEGRELFELEEQVRTLAIGRRRGPKAQRKERTKALEQLLRSLPLEQAEPVVRAFSTYFQLANLAEQNHRMRRTREHAREPDAKAQRGSLLEIFQRAKAAGATATQVREGLRALQVTLAFTAHPTQAIRRTVLEKLYRISHELEQRDRVDLTPLELSEAAERVRHEVTCLWQTDEVRRERPSVGDEVKTVLFYVEEVLWPLLPDLAEQISRGFERVFGEPLGFDAWPMRLHSWVGGDMDGNPRVTAEVFEDAARAHMARGLRRLLSEVEALGGALSQSTRHVKVTQELIDSIARDEARMPSIARQQGPRTIGEPWRRKLRFIEVRLHATLAHVEEERAIAQSTESQAGPGEGSVRYLAAAELSDDLDAIAASLEAHAGPHSGSKRVRALCERVRATGFHLVELELRAPAPDALNGAAFLRDGEKLTEGGARFLSALRKMAEVQREGGPHACQTIILSMAQSEHDVLAALDCARACGLHSPDGAHVTADVVPLCETLDALRNAPKILTALIAHPTYRRHLEARGLQEIMVGYSDSGKEVGLLAASEALLEAQTRLRDVAREHRLPLRVFHGRGESVARGGGPAQQAILALPPGAVDGRYKATEQGEAMDHKYARPALALRTLELVVGGALLHTLDLQPRPPPEALGSFRKALAELAETGRKSYRALVWEDPRFPAFFQAVTPLAEISELPIGSRPSKRSSGGLEALRAIPWVFSWTQNRAILPGWYGVGTALEQFAQQGDRLGLLQQMYREWPHFRAVIDNVEMVLAKSDPRIARSYVKLAPPELRELWKPIAAEHRRTRAWVKKLTGNKRLLDGNPSLQRSIALRNPYVDPMSFLQVELLRRKRAGQTECDRPLLLTLSGIASGLRNTG